jgi:flavin reductase (DIM6/NTAB) family NADH-FMN oxidoreductase RutF
MENRSGSVMDSVQKKRALRCFSNGIYILTSRSGDRCGAGTVSWVSQASFKPALIMAAVRRESSAFRCLSESRVAAIHVLRTGQEELAQRFFTPTVASASRINGEVFAARTTSAPILEAAPAYVECSVKHIVDGGGDHAIVVLEVVDAKCGEPFEPLTMRDSPWEYGG